MQKITFSMYNKRKKETIEIIKKDKIKILNKYLILDILDDGRLDSVVEKITYDKVIVLKSPIIPKGYLTCYEQFISILDNFISYILNYVDSPDLIKEIIIRCLDKSEILLSKRYFFDAENIEYYKHNFNILISRTFYNNLLKLKNELEDELKEININIENIDINNKDDLLCLTRLLDEIIFINKNDYKIMSLFTIIENTKYELYINWYKMLLSKYITNNDFIKAYRKYKNGN